MQVTSTWPRNRLLVALPARNFKQLMPELEHVEYRRQQVLTDADGSLHDIFFPDEGIVSAVAVYADGSIIEMANVGREGSTGFQAVLGAKTSSARLMVQVPGTGARMPRPAFVRAMEEMPAFRNLMMAHVRAFLEQAMVSAACNGAHSLRQRLARWLLMMHDRHDGDVLPLTHELLANTLGVHRPTVTKAARALQHAGLIERGRGHVTIRDRGGLVGASCECYEIARTRIARHLPKTFPD
jgi:CRP-like cAMP-binding protein